jgi:hypothetical protein
MAEPAKRSGLTKFVLACFGMLIVSLIVLAVAVAWNWGQVKSLMESARGTFVELNGARSAVAARFKAQQVNVMYKKQNGATILSVQLLNSPAYEGLSKDALKEKAREIATTARDALTSPNDYHRFEVVFLQQKGVGVTFSSSSRFVFSAAELPFREVQEIP